MSTVQLPTAEAMTTMTRPMLAKVIRELGFDPAPMDVNQCREFIKTKIEEATPKAKRGRPPKAPANPAAGPLTHQPLADLKMKVETETVAMPDVALAASTGFGKEQTAYLLSLERRIATTEAALGIAAGSASPPTKPMSKFDKIESFFTKENGKDVFTMGEAQVDGLTMEQCLQTCALLKDNDTTPETPIRVVKQRIKAALRGIYNKGGDTPQPVPGAKGVAKPPAPAVAPAAGPAKNARAAAPAPAKYKHGDLVIALYQGKPIDPTRVIRLEDGGNVLVHWGSDDSFSSIPVASIKGPSSLDWELDEVEEDTDEI